MKSMARLKVDVVCVTTVIYLLYLIGGVYSCPTRQCECVYNDVDMRYDIVCDESLTDVPTFTPQDTLVYRKLIMRKNKITRIRNNAFAGIGFDELDMSSGNLLDTIEDYAFNGTNTPMKTLKLNTNEMNVFPTLAINRQTELTTLWLEGFNLPRLPQAGPFQFLTKLEHLQIRSSKLSSLDSDVFQPQENTLQTLDLHGNAFSSVPAEAIQQLTQLQKLVLSLNEDFQLTNTPFATLSTLKELDISQTKLTSVDTNAFEGLENSLETLKLDHCRLYESRLDALAPLQKLQTLKLNHNQITNIPTNFIWRNVKLIRVKFNRKI